MPPRRDGLDSHAREDDRTVGPRANVYIDGGTDRLDGERRLKGEDAAFEALVERHAAAIHRLAVAIVGPDEAADVTQEVLVLAWQRGPQLRDAGREAAWLHRIVVNRCIDRGRAKARRVWSIPLEVRDDDARLPSTPGTATPGFDPALDAALRRLPVEQRAVIALHYAADLSLADVANALNVPVGTAKSRLASALERLRQDLGARP